MKTAIVTGASGFVGSVLTHELTSNGYQVLAIGRKQLDALSDYRKDLVSGSTYSAVDLTSPGALALVVDEFLSQATGRLDYVFHLAWYGKTRLSDLDLEAQFANVPLTVGLYELAAKYSASRFIYCGSMEEAFAEAYTKLEHRTEIKANRHVVYAMAKLAARSALKLAWQRDWPDLILMTNSHVIGIEDDKDSFLQVATSKLMREETLDMSTGEQTFDVIHVADCARAYRLAAEKGQANAIYWAGSGQARALREYVEVIAEIYSPAHVNYGVMPFNDVILPHSLFSIDSLSDDTGYRPLVSFESAVQELAESL
jgi:nucleoside-diphosphate-sugar epimerase